MSKLRNLFRFAFAIVWCSSLYYDVKYQPRLGHEWYIYKLIMLTNMNFVIQTIFSILVLMEFLSGGWFRSFLDFTFHCTVFPVSLITCGLFWSLYFIDPALIMPEWIANLIPMWLNHVTHSLPVIYVIFESLVTHRVPPSRRMSLAISTLHIVIYFIVILAVRLFDGYWLYPILELLGLEHLAMFFPVLVIGYYFLIRLSTIIPLLLSGYSQASSKSQHKYKKFQ